MTETTDTSSSERNPMLPSTVHVVYHFVIWKYDLNQCALMAFDIPPTYHTM